MFTTGGYASPIKYIFIYFNRKGGGAASFRMKTGPALTPAGQKYINIYFIKKGCFQYIIYILKKPLHPLTHLWLSERVEGRPLSFG